MGVAFGRPHVNEAGWAPGLVSIQPAAGRNVLIGVENDMIYQHEIQINTSGHRQMHDLTDEVGQIVTASHVTFGLVHIFNVGSTGAIGTIEFEPGLQEDLPASLDRIFPPSRDYGHERAWHDGNGHSHLQATMLGPSLTVPLGNLAADLSSGMRHQTPPADDRDPRPGRALARLVAHIRRRVPISL